MIRNSMIWFFFLFFEWFLMSKFRASFYFSTWKVEVLFIFIFYKIAKIACYGDVKYKYKNLNLLNFMLLNNNEQ